jgi:putative endonuclease
MHYVYILQSLSHEEQTYVGCCQDLRERLARHNSGQVTHTAKFVPWSIRTYFAFEAKEKAFAFERYLKSGSGRAFAKRHF